MPYDGGLSPPLSQWPVALYETGNDRVTGPAPIGSHLSEVVEAYIVFPFAIMLRYRDNRRRNASSGRE